VASTTPCPRACVRVSFVDFRNAVAPCAIRGRESNCILPLGFLPSAARARQANGGCGFWCVQRLRPRRGIHIENRWAWQHGMERCTLQLVRRSVAQRHNADPLHESHLWRQPGAVGGPVRGSGMRGTTRFSSPSPAHCLPQTKIEAADTHTLPPSSSRGLRPSTHACPPPCCRQTTIDGCDSLPQWSAELTTDDRAGEGGRQDLRELCRYAFEHEVCMACVRRCWFVVFGVLLVFVPSYDRRRCVHFLRASPWPSER